MGSHGEEARIQSFLRRPKRSGRSGTFQKTEDIPVDVVPLSHDKTTNTRAVKPVKVTRVGRYFLTRVDR